ncbi:MAG: hypothetical protein B6U89_05485 [Desulfurococcales archaeon ex4484_58]|nr:MAG: hypothetical protein B6U89_05485 [Desulfurococcales archaeon ex4484_58]
MAYTWEPRWEKIKIEKYGVIIHTCRDKITGMIACPICIHAASKCLGIEKIPATYKQKNIFFFTPEDLIIHIREYHTYGYLRKIGGRKKERSVG